MIEKNFIFSKGTEDWKTWDKTNSWIFSIFEKMRKRSHRVPKLKKNYRIYVRIVEQ